MFNKHEYRLAWAAMVMAGRSGDGSIDAVHELNSHSAGKAHGDRRCPLDGRCVAQHGGYSSMRLSRVAARQKCLIHMCQVVIILPTGRATINKHTGMYMLRPHGTHERYSVLWHTHEERLHEEHPTR